MAYQQRTDVGNGERGPDDPGAVERWATVRQAAGHVDRSIDWVRRQYRSGAVESRIQAGRYGPERLVDIETLVALAEAPKLTPAPRPIGGDAPAAQLPVLAETLHELAHQLGEAQERAARAEADAEALRRKLEDAQGVAPGEVAAPDHHEAQWLAANEQFLRTLPGAAAREAAGRRLSGGRPLTPTPRRRWWAR